MRKLNVKVHSGLDSIREFDVTIDCFFHLYAGYDQCKSIGISKKTAKQLVKKINKAIAKLETKRKPKKPKPLPSPQ